MNHKTLQHLFIAGLLLVTAGALPAVADCPPLGPCASQLSHVRGVGTDFTWTYWPHVATMPDGGYVVGGSFHGTLHLQTGTGSTIELTSADQWNSRQELFLVRYYADHTLAWVRQSVGTWLPDTKMTGLAVNPTDNTIYITGIMQGGTTFSDTAGTTLEFETGSWDDSFIVCYNALGDIVWGRQTYTPDPKDYMFHCEIHDIDVSHSGHVVVAGWFNDETRFDSITMKADNEQTMFLALYNPGGSIAWVRKASSYEDCAEVLPQGVSIAPDATAIYVGGLLQFRRCASPEEAVVFGRGEGNQTALSDPAITATQISGAGFLALYTPQGALVYARPTVGEGWDEVTDVDILGDHSCVVTGIFESFTSVFGTGLSSAGGEDGFVARVAHTGGGLWATRLGGPEDDEARAVAVDYTNANHLQVNGRFAATATFGAGEANQVSYTSQGETDVWFADFAWDTGALEWAKPGGGTENDIASTVSLYADGTALHSAFARGLFGACEPNETTINTRYLTLVVNLGTCDEEPPGPTATPTITPTTAPPTSTPTPTSANRPQLADVALSASTLIADGSTQYTVGFSARDADGVADMKDFRLMFNYDPADWSTARGYLGWGLDVPELSSFTLVEYQGDLTDGSVWGYDEDSFGADYLVPLACDTATAGDLRSVTWTFVLTPAWAEHGPATGNTVTVWIRDLQTHPWGTNWQTTPLSFDVQSVTEETPTPTPTPVETPADCPVLRYGDVNGDDTVNNVDALMVHSYFLQLLDCFTADTDCNGAGPESATGSCPTLLYGDVNGDDTVNNVDALMIHSFFLHLLDCFPADTDCNGTGPEH